MHRATAGRADQIPPNYRGGLNRILSCAFGSPFPVGRPDELPVRESNHEPPLKVRLETSAPDGRRHRRKDADRYHACSLILTSRLPKLTRRYSHPSCTAGDLVTGDSSVAAH